MLVFSDPGCTPCNALLPHLGRWQREHAVRLTVALLSRGTPEENRAKSAEHGLTQVLLQRDREVQQAYQVAWTPSAVLVRSDGRIGSSLAQGAEQIAALVAQGAATPDGVVPIPLAAIPTAASAPPVGPKVGDPAPPVVLQNLDGEQVDLATWRGRPTLLLFWNPGCGFCQRMLDNLKSWEAQAGRGTTRVLVISTGCTEANRAMGLRSPVVLDQGFAVAGTFGSHGTPSGILVDGQGRIASGLAVGAEAVLALARGSEHGAKAAARRYFGTYSPTRRIILNGSASSSAIAGNATISDGLRRPGGQRMHPPIRHIAHSWHAARSEHRAVKRESTSPYPHRDALRPTPLRHRAITHPSDAAQRPVGTGFGTPPPAGTTGAFGAGCPFGTAAGGDAPVLGAPSGMASASVKMSSSCRSP